MKACCNNLILAGDIKLADTFFKRFIGLMGKKSLGCEEGLLLLNCPSIHCFFMRVPIDAIYLSKEMTVLEIETLAPWRIGKYVKHTAHILELSAGAAEGKVLIGDKLEIN